MRAAVHAVPERLRAEKPAPTRWSVNEVLEHLAIVETRFSKALGDAIATARQAGLGPEQGERVPLPEKTQTVLVDRSNPRTAPEAAQPTGTLDSGAAWSAVERADELVRRTLTAADGLALGQVTYAHPFFGPLTAYQWVELLAGHRVRHAAQIRELAT